MAQRPLAVDVVVDCPCWKAARGVGALLRRAAAETAATVPTFGGEVAILLTGDSAMRMLNRDWRGNDKPTNVLSFPASNRLPSSKRSRAEGAVAPRMLGDIVIAYETTVREAKAEGKPLLHHVAHLAVHGFLHLVGYDHEARAAAEAMEELEVAILSRLDLPHPYLMRDIETAR